MLAAGQRSAKRAAAPSSTWHGRSPAEHHAVHHRAARGAVARSIHRLGVLTGRDPDALTGVLSAPRDLPALPLIVPVGDARGAAAPPCRHPLGRAQPRGFHGPGRRRGIESLPQGHFTGSFGYAAADAGGLRCRPARAATSSGRASPGRLSTSAGCGHRSPARAPVRSSPWTSTTRPCSARSRRPRTRW